MNPLAAINPLAAGAVAWTAPTAPAAVPAAELQGLRATPALEPGASALPATPGPGGGQFNHLLSQFVEEVNTRQVTAQEAVHGLLGGQNVSLHQTMIALEEASVSFQLMVEVRNKLLESYQELMRMQI